MDVYRYQKCGIQTTLDCVSLARDRLIRASCALKGGGFCAQANILIEKTEICPSATYSFPPVVAAFVPSFPTSPKNIITGRTIR